MLSRSSALVCIAVIGLSLFLGCKRESPPVASNLKSWKRDRFQPGGGNAMVFYVVYGAFTNEPAVSATKYRTAGLPNGIELRKLTRTQQPVLPFTDGDFGKLLQKDKPSLFERIEHASECLTIQGQIADPTDLNYLRDIIGLVTCFMDNGGVAVADVQQIKSYDAAEWRHDFFEPEMPRIHRHVSILLSQEVSGSGRWFHTRGMRKFGRPDLSLRNVLNQYEKGAIELCNRFIELQALGARIPEGEVVRMASLPDGLVCRHKGSLDDPDFNNVHVEIQFPTGR